MTVAYVALALVLCLLLAAALSYASLVRARRQVGEAWRRLDAQLTRRHDLVPALVEVVQRCVPDDRETPKVITGTRAAAVLAREPAVVEQTEARLTSALRRVDALAAARPQLRTSDGFERLWSELRVIEDDIQAARAAYNATVQDYNTRGRRLSLLRLRRRNDAERRTKRSLPKVAF
jgi:LemA protein